MVPSPVPEFTTTLYVEPEPLNEVILAPLTPLVVKLKFEVVNPVTFAPKVTVKVTDAAFVVEPLGVPLVIELIVVLDDETVTVKLLLALVQPVLLFLTVATKLYVFAALAGTVTLIGDAGKLELFTAEKLGIAVGEPVVIEYWLGLPVVAV